MPDRKARLRRSAAIREEMRGLRHLLLIFWGCRAEAPWVIRWRRADLIVLLFSLMMGTMDDGRATCDVLAPSCEVYAASDSRCYGVVLPKGVKLAGNCF